MCGGGGFFDPVGDIGEMAVNHVENVAHGYQEDPERAALGINTKFEGELWGQILGKDYDPLVGDLIVEGSPYTQNDFKTAKEKGIRTGPTKFVDQIARAIAMYFGGSAIAGAAGGGAEAAGTVGQEGVLSADLAPVDMEGATASSASTGASVPQTTLAEGQAGVSTSGAETLAAPATTGADSAAGFPGEVTGQSGGPTGMPPPSSPGLIDSVLGFAKANPLVTLGAGQLASGLIQGVGANMTQNQIADKKAQTDKELLAQKTEEERKLLEARRAFVQGGSSFAATVPVRPGPQQPLRRPDGSLVYAPNGLIASAMR